MPASPALSDDRRKTASLTNLRELAPQDYIVLCYVALLDLAVLFSVHTAHFARDLCEVLALTLVPYAGVYLARFSPLRDQRAVAWIYRLMILGPVQISYFMFRDLLPAINSGSLDAELHALDVRWLGVERAIAFDRFVNPLTTEWFAFFYFSYFFVLSSHVPPLLFGAKNERVPGEFLIGIAGIFCMGQVIYTIVPGFGPYHAMPEAFSHSFPHGLWLDLVMETVQEGGAQKDIFPSLHTALPTFITLMSFRHRDKAPYRYTWPIVAFFTANILIATMFLRWHYLIDVIAGLVLATLWALLSPPLVERELTRRRQFGLTQLWPQL